jgi:uracil-DNA glycosylase family 4
MANRISAFMLTSTMTITGQKMVSGMIDWDQLDTLRITQKSDPQFANLSDRYVPGEGPDNPLAFVIGEAPGAQEEIAGRPFVGPAGTMLRRLLNLAGYSSTEDCWITNTVKFRPPRNRNPTPAEIEGARQYLVAEYEAVGSPDVIIPVGGIALRAIMRKGIPITKVAGECIIKQTRHGTCYVWPMIHPSFGIRNPGMRSILEADWEKLGEWRKHH